METQDPFMHKYSLVILGLLMLTACGGTGGPEPEPESNSLRVNEVVSSNDGVSIDETGQTSDWIELTNTGTEPLRLSHYAIADSARKFAALPDVDLAPGGHIQLWADDSPELGSHHLPFKLSASGDRILLRNQSGEIFEEVVIPALAANQSFSRFPSGTGAFGLCRYATPGKSNGERCAPITVPPLEDTVRFADFPPSQWPADVAPQGIGINELALLPAQFVEFKNFSDTSLSLAGFRLVLAAYPPQSGLPAFNATGALDLPAVTLAPGEVYALTITTAQVSAIAQQAFNEGVAVLFDRQTQQPVDVVPFMHWPQERSLTRRTAYPHRFRFCENTTPGLDMDCVETQSRPVGNRTRGLYTPDDFAQLAAGSGQSNIQSVKFVVDLRNRKAVHFIGSRDWALHYTFVREVIDRDPPLNRCDPEENALFNQGWWTFSNQNYYDNQNRRYLLGTLSHHPSAGLRNVEYTFGDAITAVQMRDAFYTVTALTPDPFAWTLRPQDTNQVNRVRTIEGTLPLVGPKAPFETLVFQGLTPGIAFGTLTYVPTEELENTTLGNRIIVITDDVPNDIDFVAGLITETFQTPLAHVNLLSQSRNTPNMALPNASQLPEFQALLGKLVRLEVNEGGYSLRAASLEEAQAHWDEQQSGGEVLVPRLDRQTTQLIDLFNADLDDLPSIGAKAAQLAEVLKVNQSVSACPEGAAFAVPEKPFAIPVAHYLAHMQASGAQAYLDTLLADELFHTDLTYRKLALQTLQQMILQHPVDTTLLNQVTRWVSERFGNKAVRFRSSSNTEDLAEFNGAGLYESISAELDDEDARVDDAIRTVWASLWNLRAFEERANANVDQTQVAMGILVHLAFKNERANGVAVGRNILDPTRVDQYYFNSQAGEASVTNPAPGVVTEQLIYQWPPRTPTLTYHSYSSLRPDTRVITPSEARALACSLDAIQTHLRARLDSYKEDRWFTVETEFKFLGEERQLLIKQARPYQLRKLDIPNDCREDI
jgi:hypothetical protein